MGGHFYFSPDMINLVELRNLCVNNSTDPKGKYELDPALLYAICEQESSFRPNVVRMEPKFYSRYTEPFDFATTTEVLLAVSYGLMQVMGESLREMKFFEFYLQYHNNTNSLQLREPMSEVTVVKALNAFLVRPPWQVEFGANWFRHKLIIAKGDIKKALMLWNGGGNPNYATEVLTKYDKHVKSTLFKV